MERKRGEVVVARPDRGWWMVRVGPPSSFEIYFMHVSKIRSGTAAPELGMTVEFDVGGPGKGPRAKPDALNCDIFTGGAR